MLFNHEICNLQDWSKLFQDRSVFQPLVEHIFRQHGIAFCGLDNCTPGSNAVFRAGGYIVKIFAPSESGIGGEGEFITEKFGLEHANRLSISAPRLFGSGVVSDKYIFRYLILEYIEGESLADLSGSLSENERFRIGKSLREIVDRMDIPCERFNRHTLFGESAENRWKVFPGSFQRERKEYLEKHEEKKTVFVHGDLNPDNIIITADKKIHIIDFADALLAPVELELAGIICDGFKFDTAYLDGFMGKYDKHELAERLVCGLLMHDYGVNIIHDNLGVQGSQGGTRNLGVPEKMASLGELRDRMLDRLVRV